MIPSIVEDLCERYARNIQNYHAQSYNEAQLRQEFLNPFFKELGWDMENVRGYAEAYKEVVHEDSIRDEDSVKAPDYSFRIGGTRKFFLEAKKPRVFINDDPKPAFQLRRYAWSAKLPLSILTNFEDFSVYDCRWRPAADDNPGKHRILYLKYKDYAARWDDIANVFSREAILKGSFDKYAQEQKGKRGTQGVDDEFLADIELFREDLARNIHLRNKDLPLADLNYAVGKIIDRLLFLRVCEDRGIEEYGQIKALLAGNKIYERLLRRFEIADGLYNSGLFHFKADKERSEQPDKLTPSLTVDDKILKEIIKRLYYPESPYEFAVMPADILGQVYEQFLGKVIVKAGRTVDVEYKPEVKKAGGVYYTPTYIVDYIVKHTVGKLLEGKTPKDAETLRVLDPACGSGSFLIGAYQYLLDWHLEQYLVDNPDNKGLREDNKGLREDNKGLKPLVVGVERARANKLPVYQSARGEWRLTLDERRRILLNNIYGVDIDAQAVEVTKLSLLLKVLEGESADTVQGELKLRHHALPDLGKNIKCGNSLIGTDIEKVLAASDLKDSSATRGLSPLLEMSDEEIARINPFDWDREFPQVFAGHRRDLYLTTFVTHNSRVSERMITMGAPHGEPLIFGKEDQELVAESIADVCRKHAIPVVAWNILPDHVHMVIAAGDERELTEHVRKIKGGSSYDYQRRKGWDTGQHVWAQKFHLEPLSDERAVHDALAYVWNNRLKHQDRWGGELLDVWGEEEIFAASDGANTERDSGHDTEPNKGLGEGNKGQGEGNKGLKPLVIRIRDACTPVAEACIVPGGFDAVIGNPPYIRIQALRQTQPLSTDYFSLTYANIAAKSYDIYSLFIERALRISNSNGLIGYILPNKFFVADYGEPLRAMIAKGRLLRRIVDFGDTQIFIGASTYTCLLFLGRQSSTSFYSAHASDIVKWRTNASLFDKQTNAESIGSGLWSFFSAPLAAIDMATRQRYPKLSEIADIFQGLVTSSDAVYFLEPRESKERQSGLIRVYSNAIDKEFDIEDEIAPELCKGSRDIRRFAASPSKRVIFPYDKHESSRQKRTILIPSRVFTQKYPYAWRYLKKCETVLRSRENGKMDHDGWYGYVYPKNVTLFTQPKIITPAIASRASFTLDVSGKLYFVGSGGGGGGGYAVLIRDGNLYNLNYLLGLLNSRLLDRILQRTSSRFHGGYFAYSKQFIEGLPIRTINFSDKADKARHDRMVALVEKMLEMNKRLPGVLSPVEKEKLERQIAATDRQIDELVYELYGLTEEEIKIVEGKEERMKDKG